MERSAREVWRELVEAWAASGMTCRDFAEARGVNPSTLSWWKWKLSRPTVPASARAGRRRGEGASSLTFVEVTGEVVGRVTDAPPLRVRVGAVEVEVPANFEAAALDRVLDVLEARR